MMGPSATDRGRRCSILWLCFMTAVILLLLERKINPISSEDGISGVVTTSNFTEYTRPWKWIFANNLHGETGELEPKKHVIHGKPDTVQGVYHQSSQSRENMSQPKYARYEDVPVVKVTGVECDKLIQGNQNAIQWATSLQEKNNIVPISDAEYVNFAADCEVFRQQRKYLTKPVSQEEADFPIAFSILMHKDVELFERLLRAIYRPKNYYCVHVDKKAKSDTLKGVQTIVRCFDNVFVASKLINVVWGTYSVLEPELTCMKDLWKFKKWRYFINLTGQEFPLKTNLDLVKIMKTFNGANNVQSIPRYRPNQERIKFVYVGQRRTNIKKDPPAVNVTIRKGSVHVCVTRDYVGYVLHDERALTFRKWVKDTGVPDETFFASLNYSPQLEVPGAYKGVDEMNNVTNPFFVRHKIWYGERMSCAGKFVRDVCIFGVGDLKLMSERPEMFANKFHIDFHPLALACMEQLHHNRTRDEILGTRVFNATPYGKYDFVKNHV